MARPRTFDEEQVLAAARDAFWITGYEGTSLDDLIAATGLGKGSLYAAFGGKRELFERMFRKHCREAIAAIELQLAGDDRGAYTRLQRYVRAVATYSGSSGDGLGCLVAKTTAEIGATDAAVGAEIRAVYQAFARALTACIAAAQRNGDVAASADAASLGILVLAALRGIESLGKAGMPQRVLRQAADAALAAVTKPAAAPQQLR